MPIFDHNVVPVYCRTYKMQCAASIYVTATSDRRELVFTEVKLDHNHEVSKSVKAS